MRLEGIDILRGLAVSFVIFYHFFELLGLQHFRLYPYVSSIGQLGVPLFFIISGYLIYRSIEYSITKYGIKSGIKIYALHRIFRILPAYYFNFIIVLGLASTLIGADYFYSYGLLKQIFAHLTFTSYFLYQNSGLGVNGAYWTLSIEMLWYIIAPLFFLFITKDRYYLLFIMLAFLYLWSIDLGVMEKLFHLDTHAQNYMAKLYYFSFQMPGQILYFIAGVFIYKHFQSINFISDRRMKLFLFTLLVSSFIYLSQQNIFLSGFLIKNIITLFVVTFLFLLFYQSHIPYLGMLDWLGKISYSLYLWHMPILFVMKRSNILSHTSLLNASILFIVSVLSLSSMSYYFIEEGGFRLRKTIEH